MSTAIPPPPAPTNPTPPGVVLPTVLPYTTGTSTPMQSSYQAGINASNLQNNRNNALSGGRKKRYSRGGATSYTVPQFNMLYNPSNGPGQSPNEIIQSSVGTMGQNTANAQYDTCVGQPAGCQGQLGGTRVCHSGQTNCWGCYSGGRKTRYKKKKKVSSKYKKRKNTKKRYSKRH